MRVIAVQTTPRYHVRFSVAEAGELRAIGMLPPRFEPCEADLWITYEETVLLADLPVSAGFRDTITTVAARILAGELP